MALRKINPTFRKVKCQSLASFLESMDGLESKSQIWVSKVFLASLSCTVQIQTHLRLLHRSPPFLEDL